MLQEGVTLIQINLSNRTKFRFDIQFVAHWDLLIEGKTNRKKQIFSQYKGKLYHGLETN